jgi:hypothetical protein
MLLKALKKKLWLLFIVLFGIITAFSYVFIYSIGNSMPVEIVTLEGDESIIKDIKIQGLFGDKEAKFLFNIEENYGSAKPIYGWKKNLLEQYENYYLWSTFKFLHYDSSFESPIWYSMGYALRYANNLGGNLNDFVQVSRIYKDYEDAVETKVINISKHPSRGLSSRDNFLYSSIRNMLNGITFIEDKTYFILHSDDSHMGISGIYEIVHFDKAGNLPGRSHFYQKVVFSEDGYRKLTNIDLKAGFVQVNGLYSNEENLYVVMAEGGELKIKEFDLKEETFKKEITINGCLDTNTYFKYNLRRANVYDNKLSIVMDVEEGTKIVTIDLQGNMDKISDININYNFYDNYNYVGVRREGRVFDVLYKNDLIYILDEQKEFRTSIDRGYLRQEEYYLRLSVYDKSGNLKYSGIINTGVNDDNIIEAIENPGLIEKYLDNEHSRRKYYDVRFR